MKWMDRVWALLVLAAAAVLGALLCGHIVDAKQAQTALLLVATTALLVLALGSALWAQTDGVTSLTLLLIFAILSLC